MPVCGELLGNSAVAVRADPVKVYLVQDSATVGLVISLLSTVCTQGARRLVSTRPLPITNATTDLGGGQSVTEGPIDPSAAFCFEGICRTRAGGSRPVSTTSPVTPLREPSLDGLTAVVPLRGRQVPVGRRPPELLVIPLSVTPQHGTFRVEGLRMAPIRLVFLS